LRYLTAMLFVALPLLGCAGCDQSTTGVARTDLAPDETEHVAATSTKTEALPTLVVAYRDVTTGVSSLRIVESKLAKRGKPIEVWYSTVCRFEAKANAWQRVPWHYLGTPQRFEPVPESASSSPGRALVDLAGQPAGLYWVEWTESDSVETLERLRSAINSQDGPLSDTRHASAFLLVGPALCNDVRLDPPPPGEIAVCVPQADSAVARFVPEPATQCRSVR
jgi:hypothetical protein